MILRFHLYRTHSFKDEKFEHLSWNAIGKIHKNIDFKNIKNWINLPWLIHEFLLILNIFEIDFFDHFPNVFQLKYSDFSSPEDCDWYKWNVDISPSYSWEIDQTNPFQKCPKSTKTHVSTMDDLFNFWHFWNWYFFSFSQEHFNPNVRIFHLWTNAFDTDEIVISIPHTLRKMNKNVNFKKVKN